MMTRQSVKPLVTALLYALAGSLWIIFSSALVVQITASSELQTRFELFKGLAYVLVTSAILYFVLREKHKDYTGSATTGEAGRGYSIFVIILVLILLVPAVGYGIIRLSVPTLEKQAYENLDSIADLQLANLRNWSRERAGDLDAIRNSSGFRENLASVQADREDKKDALTAIYDRLKSVQDSYDYEAIYLLNAQEKPVTVVGDFRLGLPENLQERLDKLKATGIGASSTLMYVAGDGSVDIDIIGPVADPEHAGEISGYLLMRNSPERLVFDEIRYLPGPWNTLETLMVTVDDKTITAIHLSQIESDERERITMSLADDPLVEALSQPGGAKSSGWIQATDHHGTEVLAAYRKLEDSPWILIAKVSRKEALQSLQRLGIWVSAVVFLVLLAISGMLLLLWRQQRRNYELSLLASTAEHEHALLEQEKIYRELFRANPHPMWVYDLETLAFLAVNGAAVDHYGYSESEFLAMTIADIRPGQDAERLYAHIGNQPGEGIDRAGVWRHCKKDGAMIDVEISSHRLEFDGRSAELVLAYDVTEKLLNEQRLRESDRFVRDVLDSLNLNIAVLDAEGVIVGVNSNWRAFAHQNNGLIEATTIGVSYPETCRRAAESDPDVAAILHGLDNVLNGKTDRFSYEYPCHSPDEQRWYLAHFVRFQGEGPTHVVVSHENITERKRVELELKKLNRYYDALSSVNAAIIRADDQDTMLKEVCRIAATYTELRLVSIARVEGGKISLGYAEYGASAAFSDAVKTGGDFDIATGETVLARVVREQRTMVVNDIARDSVTSPWASQALAWEIRSVLISLIKRRDGVWGAIQFCAGSPGYFSPDLIALLEELTADLAYSLDVLEVERQRREAETQVLFNARIIESTHEGLFITDSQNRITLVNQAMEDITGYTRGELVGRNPHMLSSGEHDENFYRDLWAQLEESGWWEGEIWDRRKDGTVFPAWLAITRVDHPGNGYHHIAIYRDITDRKEYERRIEHLASHDLLTNLPNRVLLEDRALMAIAQAERHQYDMAMLFIDLDQFKLINDTLGHEVGDELLVEIARRISGVLRTADTVSRVGGDEFVALLGELHSTHDAAMVAQKLIGEISRPLVIRDRSLVITASVGIALYPENADTLDGLMRLADIAMLTAKRSGQNRFHFYSGEMGSDASEHLYLLNELRHAADRDEIFLVYQPQYQMTTGRPIGAEVLVRWRHPDLGLISPMRFIPIAEESGLIIGLGEWILHSACAQARDWLDRNIIDYPVSVNVSGLQFRQKDFVDSVARVLADTGLPASYLELELTESLLMDDIEDVLVKLGELKRLGVTVAIDDFGTGYSSLSYLRQFSAHRFKIDKSFINDLPDDQDAAAIAQSVVSMGKSLGMEIIAEGVETEEQVAYLTGIGCLNGQGYFFARPMEVDAFEAHMAKGTTD